MGNIAALSTLAATFIEKEVDFWAANLLGTVLVSATQALLWFSGPRLRESGPFALQRRGRPC